MREWREREMACAGASALYEGEGGVARSARGKKSAHIRPVCAASAGSHLARQVRRGVAVREGALWVVGFSWGRGKRRRGRSGEGRVSEGDETRDNRLSTSVFASPCNIKRTRKVPRLGP